MEAVNAILSKLGKKRLSVREERYAIKIPHAVSSGDMFLGINR